MITLAHFPLATRILADDVQRDHLRIGEGLVRAQVDGPIRAKAAMRQRRVWSGLA